MKMFEQKNNNVNESATDSSSTFWLQPFWVPF